MTDAPPTITFASLVLRKMVWIAHTLAGLNELQVKVSNIKKVYITALCTEKIWTVLGPEFGSNAGKRAIVICTLCSLKSTGASFCNHLANCMTHLGFKPCLADMYLLMLALVHPLDGNKYYAYVLIYVHDVLVVHHAAEDILLHIDAYFKMKPSIHWQPQHLSWCHHQENSPSKWSGSVG